MMPQNSFDSNDVKLDTKDRTAAKHTMTPSRLIIPVLSLTLLLSWGSLYYAFATLAPAIQNEMQWSATSVMGAYSVALLVWGLCTYSVGRFIDRYGGQLVMTLGSCLCGALFLILSTTKSIWVFYFVWGAFGAGMALTLYEPAFAILVETWPNGYRRRIGVLTLAGGLASTVFWPLTHWLVNTLGWRDTALVYAVVHFFICAPLHWVSLPNLCQHRSLFKMKSTHPKAVKATYAAKLSIQRSPAFWFLAISFAAMGFVTAAIATHLVPIIESKGLATSDALAVAMIIGPMQVAGRSLDVLLAGRLNSLATGVLTVSCIPVAILALWSASKDSLFLYVFVVFYGLGLGLLTIVRATTPAIIFGVNRYASISGALSAPSVLARAAGPLAGTFLVSKLYSFDTLLIALAACAFIGALSYLMTIWNKVS
jgi:MFS family permease